MGPRMSSNCVCAIVCRSLLGPSCCGVDLMNEWWAGIEFGTAGLRGRMAAGFSCMNSLTVIQASQGLAKFIKTKRPEIASQGVVIGHDARHNSDRFAVLAANAFIALQIPVWFFEQLPYPLSGVFCSHLFLLLIGIIISSFLSLFFRFEKNIFL